jgi:ketose-bisphosphate aldolase
MPGKILKNYLKKAQKGRWAIGQFNVSNLETLKAIIFAAKSLKSPVIIGTSEGESEFLGLEEAAALVRVLRQKYHLPVFLNLDHGHSFGYIKKAMAAGYEAVHFDGSALPLERNARITKKVVNLAKRKGISVEGEVGQIAGSSRLLKSTPRIRKEDLAVPDKVLSFVKKTKVDRVAVNIGTFHGVAKLGREKIDFKLLNEIKRKIGGRAVLVLHGGSGIDEKQIKRAIKSGIVKININTELRIAFTRALKKALKKSSREVVPYKYMPEVISSVKKVVEKKIRLFGSNNKI